MVKKLLCVVFAFALASTCVFAAAGVSSESVGAPRAVSADSPCPATGCAGGECHDYANVPGPDGVHEMVAPSRLARRSSVTRGRRLWAAATGARRTRA